MRSASATQWVQRHTTSHLENKRGKVFSVGQVVVRHGPALPPGKEETTQAV
jgi:hypothetical protein